MITTRINRGHESPLHRALKQETSNLLPRLGFQFVLCEYLCADIVAMGYGGVLAVEVELSVRNVLRNLERDFANGCNLALVVCADLQTLRAVARKLDRELPAQLRDRVGLVSIETLRALNANGNSRATDAESRLFKNFSESNLGQRKISIHFRVDGYALPENERKQ